MVHQKQSFLTSMKAREREVYDPINDGHLKRIEEHEQGIHQAGPAVSIVAPVACRVAQEDRRRHARLLSDPILTS